MSIPEKDLKKLSKFISLILRHQPEAAGIPLDRHGWADISALIEGIRKTGRQIDFNTLIQIVNTDEKGRYRVSDDGKRIRANQGHSIPIDVELKEADPPDILYHGTAKRFLSSIMGQGLLPMNRLYVHLSADFHTAVKVGQRHGKPIVLKIDAENMVKKKIQFYLSENGVWLTKRVDPIFIQLMKFLD